jgi:hypothetical protein
MSRKQPGKLIETDRSCFSDITHLSKRMVKQRRSKGAFTCDKDDRYRLKQDKMRTTAMPASWAIQWQEARRRPL